MIVLEESPSPEKPGAATVSTGGRKETLVVSGTMLLVIGSLTWTDTTDVSLACFQVTTELEKGLQQCKQLNDNTGPPLTVITTLACRAGEGSDSKSMSENSTSGT
ncbi:hypothetical protein ABBQ38_007388 [Trebouxia sp. C0009 RCD-2024]